MGIGGTTIFRYLEDTEKIGGKIGEIERIQLWAVINNVW